MKVLSINLGAIGSTGVIMRNLHQKAVENGFTSKMAVPFDQNKGDAQDYFFITNEKKRRRYAHISIVTGLDGCFPVFATKRLLKRIKEYAPDLIHLHNLHHSYINVKMLFKYIKKHNVKVVWTLHDCWSFTGHCPYFDIVECEKWKTGCYKCPNYKIYPKSIYDNSRFMWKWKKKWFTGVKDLTVVTPSAWLANLVKQSFLKEYPVKVINNGIELSAFKSTKSDFREKYNLTKKRIVLAVAFDWGERKGLDVIIELSKRLPSDYQIVLVGTNEHIDKQLPDNVMSIHRTTNQQELAEIYTASDVFVNPTREENYPTVNMEAIACGTPVITFDTGGSPEILDKCCGVVVKKNDVDSLEKAIIKACEEKTFTEADCLERAKAFDMHKRFDEYIALYKEL